MRAFLGYTLAVGTLTACSLGCAHAAPRLEIENCAAGNLVFNPDWAGLPSFDVGRSDWPATEAFSTDGEETLYQVRILDRFGHLRGHDDFYYRRFSSVGSGRLFR